MKLPIKKKYFDEIMRGRKKFEIRDAHITFICEETGERLRKTISKAEVLPAKTFGDKYVDVIEDKEVIVMYFKD